MRPIRSSWPLALLLWALLGMPAAAQEEDGSGLLGSLPVAASDDEAALAALSALREGKNVEARELAEKILSEDPESFIGHCLLGVVLHRAEGNLPLALYHLERGRDIFERRFGVPPANDDPWFWHGTALAELAFVSGSMGRHRDKLRYLAEREGLYEPRWPADRGWPLMRLRRYDEAREAAIDGLLMSDDTEQVATAHTALCAIEAEQHDRQASYEACLAAADYDRQQRVGGPAVYTNAAEAALGLLRFDQAERFMLEGTERFVVGTVANPWLDLTLLYVGEGRMPEALDTLRRMFTWRHRQPAYMDEQNRAETEMASASFLLAAGHPREAAKITGRALARPDRTGFTSSETGQIEAGAALLDSLAHRMSAELAAEAASWQPMGEGWLSRLKSAQERLGAWSSARRAAALLAEERILMATLRPYLAGAVEVPEWLEPELCALLGPGVVSAALNGARELEELDGVEGYFAVFEAESAFLRRRYREAQEAADRALRQLPGSEVLMRARSAALGGASAYRVGDLQAALALYDQAFQLDPGALRRLGLALPATFSAGDGPVAQAGLGFLRRSPRLSPSRAGFEVRISGEADQGRACLVGSRGAVISCSRVTARGGESSKELARRLAAAFHEETFAPRLDLTQSDLRSLDGSPTAAGGRSAERMRQVLEQVVGTAD